VGGQPSREHKKRRKKNATAVMRRKQKRIMPDKEEIETLEDDLHSH